MKQLSHLTSFFVVAIFLTAASAQKCDWWALTDSAGITGVDGPVLSFAIFDDGSGPSLIAGGVFTTAGTESVNYIARWDGENWSALTGPDGVPGVNGAVHAMVVFDNGNGPELYAGGEFTKAGSTDVEYVARWDGTQWEPVGSLPDTVRSLGVHDIGPDRHLFVGTFRPGGGIGFPGGIYQLDGNDWSLVGGGIDEFRFHVDSILSSQGKLYIGGFFNQVGTAFSPMIAEWDGSKWSAVGALDSTGRTIFGLAEYAPINQPPTIFATGSDWTSIGGVSANRIAMWDGSNWNGLVDADTGVNGIGSFGSRLHASSVTGELKMYAAGSFTTAGGKEINRIASWDGHRWSSLAGGLSDHAIALVTFNDGSGPSLYVGGTFIEADEQTVNYIARWKCQFDCLADLDGNGSLNFFDIAGFLAYYQIQDPIADWNGDGLFNFFDFAAYLNDFNAGCP